MTLNIYIFTGYSLQIQTVSDVYIPIFFANLIFQLLNKVDEYLQEYHKSSEALLPVNDVVHFVRMVFDKSILIITITDIITPYFL